MPPRTPELHQHTKGGGAMKAIRIHEPTGINGLVYEEAPDATPGLCDVLVKVAACGITHNELDWPIWTCRAGHQRTSIIPGHEVSGIVAALGYGTAGMAVGDEVFGLTDQFRDGAAAEYAAVEARNLAPKPHTADHVHAAAVPRAGLTAWQALFDHGRLARGQTVVIHGAGGAVGSTAVQLARWAGAQVIGTGRSRARPLATELGADRFIALDADRLEDAAGQADLVLDTIGGEVLARELARLVDEGHLRPQVGAVYPLAEAAKAYNAKAAGGELARVGLAVPAQAGLSREVVVRLATDHPVDRPPVRRGSLVADVIPVLAGERDVVRPGATAARVKRRDIRVRNPHMTGVRKRGPGRGRGLAHHGRGEHGASMAGSFPVGRAAPLRVV